MSDVNIKITKRGAGYKTTDANLNVKGNVIGGSDVTFDVDKLHIAENCAQTGDDYLTFHLLIWCKIDSEIILYEVFHEIVVTTVENKWNEQYETTELKLVNGGTLESDTTTNRNTLENE